MRLRGFGSTPSANPSNSEAFPPCLQTREDWRTPQVAIPWAYTRLPSHGLISQSKQLKDTLLYSHTLTPSSYTCRLGQEYTHAWIQTHESGTHVSLYNWTSQQLPLRQFSVTSETIYLSPSSLPLPLTQHHNTSTHCTRNTHTHTRTRARTHTHTAQHSTLKKKTRRTPSPSYPHLARKRPLKKRKKLWSCRAGRVKPTQNPRLCGGSLAVS